MFCTRIRIILARKTFRSSFIKKNNFVSEVTLDTKPYKLHKLDNGPPSQANLTRDEALTYYRQLFFIRRMELAASNLYKEKVIRGFCHLYSGQEAVAVGIHASMRKGQDTMLTSYRAHGWAYLMGVSVLGVMAELTGRESGIVRGKGGSMHLYTNNFFGGNGIVGAQVPLGAGIAFTHKYKKDGGVCFCLYGDGAANQGQIFEVYNLSKLWSLPVIYVCENNGYGMGTSADRSSASTDYYTRGDYIPGIYVDGMDVISVREATKFAIDHCISGKGPIVMEVVTYRYYGHSMSDPGTSYRSREEIKQVRETRDPITGFKDQVIKSNLVTDDDIKKIEADVKREIDEAVQKSRTDPEISVKEVSFDVYVECLEQEIRNNVPFLPLHHERVGKLLIKQ